MKPSRKTGGFTLLEIMVVVCVIGILLAIAVPNFMRARASARLKTIVANLNQVDSAVAQYGMENNLNPPTPLTQSNLDGTSGTTAYLSWPTGPVQGTYSVTNVGVPATFDGGNVGAMDGTAWQSACTSDPQVCGL
jgi:prepilin-type N-terminal cleavage/methylation domain-containing protein